MLLCALFVALTAVCSQIAIPLPSIPINLALFAVTLCGATLGAKLGAISMAAYMLLGILGAPVFVNFNAGPGALFGNTGGYILGYIAAAATAGALAANSDKLWRFALANLAGILACYLLGTLWFMRLSGLSLGASLAVCVLPCLPGDAVKLLLAAYFAKRLRPRAKALLKKERRNVDKE
jgi:biotin transport system substrate-specific component